MANKEKFFPALCAKLGCPELGADPRFSTFEKRLENRALLTELLDPKFRIRTTAEWLTALSGSVPAAPVVGMEETLKSPFVAERSNVVEVVSELAYL